MPPVNNNTCVVQWKNQKEMLLSQEIHALLPRQSGVSSNKMKELADLLGSGGQLLAILRARQSCVLPSLMRSNMLLFSRMGLITPEYMEALDYSSKLDAVIDLMLQRKDNAKGKIVFCHYQREIDSIAERLEAGGMKKVIRYDGRNSGGQNLASLAEPADALVIQIQTGCEGLNLQQNFSEIYFVSPHWNPCIEDQAIARCHRIGQINPVEVFKFEMNGFAKDKGVEIDPITLDKYVNKVQDLKREISRQIFEIE
jgi:SNF2 family DNA or RNA helicase